MKRGKRPTRRQKELLSKRKLDSNNWLVIQDTNEYIEIASRKLGKLQVIIKKGYETLTVE